MQDLRMGDAQTLQTHPYKESSGSPPINTTSHVQELLQSFFKGPDEKPVEFVHQYNRAFSGYWHLCLRLCFCTMDIRQGSIPRKQGCGVSGNLFCRPGRRTAAVRSHPPPA